MRFKLTLAVLNDKKALLPLNYQYELSSWIYKVIDLGDAVFSEWLHSHGYTNKKKQFRLFTFSNLNVPQKEIIGDRLLFKTKTCDFILSTLPDETLQHFICGLFRDRQLMLGDRITQVRFQVQNVEALPEIAFTESMKFRSVSPILVSNQIADSRYAQYLRPDYEGYFSLMMNNCKKKHLAFYNEDIDIDFDRTEFKVLITPKMKGISIKSHTEKESKLIGYNYTFSIKAPARLIRTAYYTGFGEKNSQGFGCVEVGD